MTIDESLADFDSSVRTARTTARRGRADVLSIAALLLATAAVWLAWGGRSVNADGAQLGERLERVEADLQALKLALGPGDTAGRSATDRLLVAENKDLLLHETLERLVEHVRELEHQLAEK